VALWLITKPLLKLVAIAKLLLKLVAIAKLLLKLVAIAKLLLKLVAIAKHLLKLMAIASSESRELGSSHVAHRFLPGSTWVPYPTSHGVFEVGLCKIR
jgi:hypothetical protein